MERTMFYSQGAQGNRRFCEVPCQRTGDASACVCRISLAVGRTLLLMWGEGAAAEILQNLRTAEFLRGPLLHAGKLETEFPRSKRFFRKTAAFQNEQNGNGARWGSAGAFSQRLLRGCGSHGQNCRDPSPAAAGRSGSTGS